MQPNHGPDPLSPEQLLGLTRRWWAYREKVVPMSKAFAAGYPSLWIPLVRAVLDERKAAGLWLLISSRARKDTTIRNSPTKSPKWSRR